MEDPSRARWLGESGMFPGAPSLGAVDVCQIHAASQRSKNRHSIVWLRMLQNDHTGID